MRWCESCMENYTIFKPNEQYNKVCPQCYLLKISNELKN